MQTNLIQTYLDSAIGQEANRILRTCVHCGFCTATCPTYQLLADELDGPRGRIYLIKQVLEGETPTAKTQAHLDRCLTCRSCETTCPSGVQYGHLLDIGRDLVEHAVSRPLLQRLQRYGLRKILPYPRRFMALLRIGRLFKPLLPASLQAKIPPAPPPVQHDTSGLVMDKRGARLMLMLDGCAQSVATPNTNAAAAAVLHAAGIGVINASGCCGAVSHHLAAAEEGLAFARRNIDTWWPLIEHGAEAIISSASGCGVMVKDYGHLLRDDPAYADKAQRVSALAKDLSEVLRDAALPRKAFADQLPRVAFHSPCTLQHGQQLDGVAESVLQRAGFELTAVADSHLCCGSAGTYSILQPTLSQQLLSNKLAALQAGQPDIIATANVGCQLHLGSRAVVKHWVEVLAEHLQA